MKTKKEKRITKTEIATACVALRAASRRISCSTETRGLISQALDVLEPHEAIDWEYYHHLKARAGL